MRLCQCDYRNVGKYRGNNNNGGMALCYLDGGSLRTRCGRTQDGASKAVLGMGRGPGGRERETSELLFAPSPSTAVSATRAAFSAKFGVLT